MTTQRPGCPWGTHQISVKCMILLLAEIVSNSGIKSFVRLGNFEIKITHTAMLFSTMELLVWMVHTLSPCKSGTDRLLLLTWWLRGELLIFTFPPWWPPLLLLRPWPPLQTNSFPATLILPPHPLPMLSSPSTSRARQTGTRPLGLSLTSFFKTDMGPVSTWVCVSLWDCELPDGTLCLWPH